MMNDDGVYIPEPTVSKPAGASSQRCGGASCGGCLDGLWEPLRRESHHLTQRQPGESLPALPVLASGREAKAEALAGIRCALCNVKLARGMVIMCLRSSSSEHSYLVLASRDFQRNVAVWRWCQILLESEAKAA